MSVINGLSNAVTATVAVGAQPYAIALWRHGRAIYVTNQADNTVSVITPSTVQP